MKDVLKLFEGMMKQPPKIIKATRNFKLAAHYYRAGWKILNYCSTNNDDIVIKFEKNEELKEVRLTLQDQIKWLQLLERNNKNESK